MRILSLVLMLFVAGCVPLDKPPPKVIVKTVTKVVVEKAPSDGKVTNIYPEKCPPPQMLSAHCNKIDNKEACDGEQRCEWVKSEERRPHCRRIRCKDTGKPFKTDS
jgi:hypothetical protein